MFFKIPSPIPFPKKPPLIIASDAFSAWQFLQEVGSKKDLRKGENPVRSINILDNQIITSKLRIKQAWSSSMPSIEMSAGINASSADQLTRGYFDDNYIKSVNIRLSIPIFSGFRNKNNIQIAKLRLDQAETRLSGGTNSAKVSLYALINTLNNYQEIIPIQEEVLLSAEEDLKLAQQRYELGSASILELLDAQLALIQASSSLVRTKYDAAIQVANLDNLLGTLDKKYE